MDDDDVISNGMLVVCGLPEAGRLRVQRRDGEKSSLADVYGAPEVLFATPRLPDDASGLASTLPHLCMPDGVGFRDTPPPPPRFFTTLLPGADGANVHLAVILFYEELPAERLMPLLMHAINSQTAQQQGSGSADASASSKAAAAAGEQEASVGPAAWVRGGSSEGHSTRRADASPPKSDLAARSSPGRDRHHHHHRHHHDKSEAKHHHGDASAAASSISGSPAGSTAPSTPAPATPATPFWRESPATATPSPLPPTLQPPPRAPTPPAAPTPTASGSGSGRPPHEPPPPETTSLPATARPTFPQPANREGFGSPQEPPSSSADVGGSTRERHKRREAAMKVLRAKGLPLGVCAVALHQAEDDVERALAWLQHGRGLQLLKAYEAAREKHPAQTAAAAAAEAAEAAAYAADGHGSSSPPPSPPPSPPAAPAADAAASDSAAAHTAGAASPPAAFTPPAAPSAPHGAPSAGGGRHGGGSGKQRLWALKALAVLSPWPLHAFWREYLYALLCTEGPSSSIDRRIKLLSTTTPEKTKSGSLPYVGSAEPAGGFEARLLPRSGGLPPEQMAAIMRSGGPSTVEATRLVAAGTLWARLPRTLIVCTTPSANAAATIAAATAPMVFGGHTGMSPHGSERGSTAAPPADADGADGGGGSSASTARASLSERFASLTGGAAAHHGASSTGGGSRPDGYSQEAAEAAEASRRGGLRLFASASGALGSTRAGSISIDDAAAASSSLPAMSSPPLLTGPSRAPEAPRLPSRLLHAQRQHHLATLTATIASVPPPLLSLLLSALAANWSVALFSRDATLLSQVCAALLLALQPLRWLGVCLPCVPRSRQGHALLARLRPAAKRVPMLLGIVQPAHSPRHPPSTPTTPRTLHVLLPDGRPLWAAGEKLPILPVAIARRIERAILDATGAADVASAASGADGSSTGGMPRMPPPTASRHRRGSSTAARSVRARLSTGSSRSFQDVGSLDDLSRSASAKLDDLLAAEGADDTDEPEDLLGEALP